MAELALEVDNVTLYRGETPVLKGLSLDVPRGAPFAIVGESGSGKTSLLHGVMGLLPVRSGQIRVAGQEISHLDERTLAKRVGLVFQDYQLFPHLSVMENLMLAPRLAGLKEGVSKAHGLLEEFQIRSLADRYAHELSGGQKQRVAIARALMLDPGLLFFDEPSSALDIQTSRELSQTLKRLQEKTQVVVVSHDREFIRDCCSHGVQLDQGRIGAQGLVTELMG